MERELLKQKWVSGPVEENGHLPVFRREFHIVKPIKEAIVYISGVGHFELHVNGKRLQKLCWKRPGPIMKRVLIIPFIK